MCWCPAGKETERLRSARPASIHSTLGRTVCVDARRRCGPFADGTLVKLPVGRTPRTRVTVIGDGAVSLLAVLSGKRLGAEQIILMGRHAARTELGREFGATDVVSTRGEERVNEVRELTGGCGTHVVLEAVGNMRRGRSWTPRPTSAACPTATARWPTARRSRS